MEMTVAFEPLPGNCSYRLDRPQFRLTSGTEVDRLHRHCWIMHQPAVWSIAGVIPNSGLGEGGLAAEGRYLGGEGAVGGPHSIGPGGMACSSDIG